MLPLQLLRIKVFNKGRNISPLYCSLDGNSYELKLAADMIKELEESFRKRETKRLLGGRISLLEASYDDYKLVRGLYTLLERRCIFISGGAEKPPADVDGAVSEIDPFYIRKYLFEESSARGYALDNNKKKEVINSVSSKIKISYDLIMRNMWADLDENAVLNGFRTLEPEKLLAQYNLSSMQTMLFNCTKLEFNVQGGNNWKRALRTIKRLGLMYKLDYVHREIPQEHMEISCEKPYRDSDNTAKKSMVHTNFSDNNKSSILCSIDGPLSIFKQTDRYGTLIAKFLPSIVANMNWSLRALIVRKTSTMGKKISEFIISSSESPTLPSESDLFSHNNGNTETTVLEKTSLDVPFDSSVERKFALKFEQLSNGWKLIREPDPIILSGGKGFIPDFAFEKYGIRVYMEIVGFWTNDYLVRKLQKLADIFSSSSSSSSSSSLVDRKNFFIAVNTDSYVSGGSTRGDHVLASLRLSDYIGKDQLIVYKNANVPTKPIFDHLRAIDLKMVEKMARINKIPLTEELKRITKDESVISPDTKDIISIEGIAEKNNIPVESILQIVKDSIDTHEAIYEGRYLVDKYLITAAKIKEIKPLLGNGIRYIDACRILAEHQIPETCFSSILYKIGYDIVWHSLDLSGATIKLHDP